MLCLSLALNIFTLSLAQARIFTGAFYAESRGCHGGLWIRTRTIQWNTNFSNCYSTYTIVKRTFKETLKNYDYILYKVDHPGKACSWKYIGLYYYDYFDSLEYSYHWTASGFSSWRDYLAFPYRGVITGTGNDSDVLTCEFRSYSDPVQAGWPSHFSF